MRYNKIIMKPIKFDVICIGAGSGGLAIGLATAKIGLKVLIIEKDSDNIGGECLNSGCIPSKALLHASRQYDSFNKAIAYVKERRSIIEHHESIESLEDQGLTILIGAAKFTSKNVLEVNEKKYSAKKIVIATGSKPRTIELKNHGQVPIVTNEQIFQITNPTHVGIIGGGPIGCEIAQAFGNLGIKVTLIERGNRLLPHDPQFAGNLVQKNLKDLGITVCYEQEVVEVDYGNRMHLKPVGNDGNSNDKLSNPVSHILLAIGRDRDFSDLDLKTAGIRINDKGDPVLDSYNRSVSNKQVVFAGDASGDPTFSHMAEEHARIHVTNWLSPFAFKKPRLNMVPWVTFTNYQVAKFGKSRKNLDSNNKKYRIVSGDFNRDDRAITDSYQDARYELYIGKGLLKEHLLGGIVVSPHAGELVQELMLVTEQKLPLASIRNKFYAYPTAGRFWQKVLLDDLADRWIDNKIRQIVRILFTIGR